MANKGQRMIFEDEYQYLKDLKENHQDPSAEWGGSDYTAGTGIEINGNNVISVDNTIATKSEIPTATSELINDSNFVPSTVLANVAFTGSYSDLSGTPSGMTVSVKRSESNFYEKTFNNWPNVIFIDDVQGTGSYLPVAGDIAPQLGDDLKFRSVDEHTNGDSKSIAVRVLYVKYSDTIDIEVTDLSNDYDDLINKPDAVSGTNDGTNWTSLTVNGDTYNIPQGGGSSYTFTNGLTENSGTVSWDYNDYITKSVGTAYINGIIIGNDNAINYPSAVSAPKGNLVILNKENASAASGTVGLQNAGNLVVARVGANSSINVRGGYGSIIAGSATGQGNISAASNSICVGQSAGYNAPLGSSFYSCTQSFGTSSVPTSSNQMVLGKFNDTSNTSNCLFVIGNGESNSSRSNAMTVSTDGVIVSKNLPAVDTTTDGTYVLEATVSNGTVTYNWVLKQ